MAALKKTNNVLNVNSNGVAKDSKEANISRTVETNVTAMTPKYILLLKPIICFFKIIENIRKDRMVKAAISKNKLKPICVI